MVIYRNEEEYSHLNFNHCTFPAEESATSSLLRNLIQITSTTQCCCAELHRTKPPPTSRTLFSQLKQMGLFLCSWTSSGSSWHSHLCAVASEEGIGLGCAGR